MITLTLNTIEDFGREVRRHRRAAGLSQDELADLAGVGRTMIQRIETGTPQVQLDNVLAVLGALNICISFDSPLLQRHGRRSVA